MRKRMKWIVAAAVLAVLGLGAYAAASPYLAVRGLLKAAEARDTAGITERVDFPALRQSLKQAMSARLEETLRRNPNDPLSALGRMFGPSIVSQLVDAFATPDNVARLVQGRVPLEALAPALPAGLGASAPTSSQPQGDAQSVVPGASTDVPSGAQPSTPSQPPAGQPDAKAQGNNTPGGLGGGPSGGMDGGPGGGMAVSMGYESMDLFVVRVADKKKPAAEPLRLEFRRQGLLDWKLCAVRLPK